MRGRSDFVVGKGDKQQSFPIYPDRYYRRLLLEGFFIHRGFVQLSLAEWRQLPAPYASRLYIVLGEMDKLAAKQK